jgi:hypothetical protein
VLECLSASRWQWHCCSCRFRWGDDDDGIIIMMHYGWLSGRSHSLIHPAVLLSAVAWLAHGALQEEWGGGVSIENPHVQVRPGQVRQPRPCRQAQRLCRHQLSWHSTLLASKERETTPQAFTLISLACLVLLVSLFASPPPCLPLQRSSYCRLLDQDLSQRLPSGRGPSVTADVLVGGGQYKGEVRPETSASFALRGKTEYN